MHYLEDPAGLAEALHIYGHLTLDQGKFDQADKLFRESLGIFQELGDMGHAITIIGDLGFIAYHRGDTQAARRLYEEGIAQGKEHNLKDNLAQCLDRLGDLERYSGNYERAEEQYTESLTILREFNARVGVAGILHSLGYLAGRRGDMSLGRAYFLERLGVQREVGNPVRAEEGSRIRQAFVPEKGCSIVSTDYSQIELRLLAHLSQDETLTKAFQKDEDIHARTASEIFGVPMEKVTPPMRREAKVINFGIIYGMSPYGLSQQLRTEPKIAQDYIDEYFKKYSGVQTYIEKSLESTRQKGYVTTLLHRRRYLPDIHSPTVAIRQATERMAINTPLQGTAADIIKISMIHIQNRIQELGLSTKMIMQVHDELVFEVPEEELQKTIPMIQN